MTKSIKKIFICLLLVMLINTYIIRIVYADDTLIDTDSTDENTGGDQGGQPPGGGGGSDSGGGSGSGNYPSQQTTTAEDGYTVYCKYGTSLAESSKVYLQVYDTNGVKQPDVLNITTKITAGRFFGINLYEEKTRTKTTVYEVTAEKVSQVHYWCTPACRPATTTKSTSKKTTTSARRSSRGWTHVPAANNNTKVIPRQIALQCQTTIDAYEVFGDGIQACRDAGGTITQTGGVKTPRNPTASEIAWCKGLLQTDVSLTMKASYIVSVKNSNNKETDGTIYDTSGSVTGVVNCNPTQYGGSGNTITATKKCTIKYDRSGVCMNTKTANVRYAKECNDDEIAIKKGSYPNDSNYWPYFVPLDTKSNETFSISLTSSGEKMSVNICKNIVTKYDDYTKKIIRADGITQFSSTKSTAKSQIDTDGGCKYKTEIVVPINQKFYNEKTENGETKIEGYKFYYKPIDISTFGNETFPTDSYWSKWSEKQKNPDLSKSFDNLSYIAKPTIGKIRGYNSTHKYTDWSDMNANGTSSLIGALNRNGEYGISRKTTDFYKLGCGPVNSSWGGCK